jgi:hypothetical protein
VNVVPLTEAGRTASEKVAVTFEVTSTLVAALNGDTPVTVGGVPSGGSAVVNVQTTSCARLLPATSSAPVVTRAV